jgi:hypothetical protein
MRCPNCGAENVMQAPLQSVCDSAGSTLLFCDLIGSQGRRLPDRLFQGGIESNRRAA